MGTNSRAARRAVRPTLERFEDRTMLSGTTITIDGFLVTNAVTNGTSVQGNANLPLVGSVHLNGTVTNGTQYQLSANVPTLSISGLKLTSDTVTLRNTGLTLEGNITLPLAGSVHLTGTITDTTHFSLSANAVQVGSFLRTNLLVQWNATSKSAVVNFNNVAVNAGGFASGFVDTVVQDLKNATHNLVPLARFLTSPLPGLSSTSDFGTVLHTGDISVLTLLSVMGDFTGNPQYATAAQQISAFANAIVGIDNLSLPTSSGSWISLGSFTASAAPSGSASSFVIGSSRPLMAAGSQLQSALSGFQPLANLGIKFPVMSDPTLFFKLMVGDPTQTLVTYSLPQFNDNLTNLYVPIAEFPVYPGITVSGGITATINVQAGATFGLNTSSVASGNLLNGFYVKNASISAQLSVGPQVEADLGDPHVGVAGYRFAGVLGYQVTAAITGNTLVGTYSGPNNAIVSTAYGPHADAYALPESVQGENQPLFGGKLNPLYWFSHYHSINDLVKGLVADRVGLSTIANALYNGVTSDLNTIANALWTNATRNPDVLAASLWGNATTDLGKLSGALSSLDSNLGQVIHALSGVVNDVGQVATAVWHNFNGPTFYPDDLAKALWTNWGGKTGFGLGDLAGAISGIDSNLGQVIHALSGVVNDVRQVASAVWHNFNGPTFYPDDLAKALWTNWGGKTGFGLGDLAGAISGIDSNLGQVIHALSGVVNDVGQVATAVWHNFNGPTFYPDDLAKALWSNWGGKTGFGLGDLAGAISGIDGSLSDVVYALKTVNGNAGQVASAVWNNWRGSSGFSGNDLIGVLEGAFGLSFLNALGIVNGL